MTTLALYAASALLRAAVTADPQYGPEATADPGQDPGAAAVAPGDAAPSPMTWERGDATDPGPTAPRVQARSPRARDGAATERALAAPAADATARSDSIDAYLFQQQTWTGP